MKKKIDSTFYFFQYLIIRIIVIGGIGFLIYSLIKQEAGAIVCSSLFVTLGVFILKKQVPKPTDLTFNEDFLYFDNLSNPILIEDILSIENGVIFYNFNGEVSKMNLPNYYFIDKNYKKLKGIIENKCTKTQ